MFCLNKNIDTKISANILLIIVFLLDHNHPANGNLRPSELVIQLAQANNDFALDMFDIMSTPHGNQVISPISLLSAFGILYTAASGSTREKLEEFLNFRANNLNDFEVKESFKYLFNSLIKKINKNDKIELNIFNAVLAQTSLELKPEFKLMARTNFKANVIIDNFKNADSLTDLINQMVKTQTNDKIEKLIENKLDPQTELMIFNVVYFRGLWQIQFQEKDTKNQIFWNSKNEKEKVKMMTLAHKEFNYIKAPGVLDAEILELPYLGNLFSLVILLPRERQGLIRLKLNFNSKHVMNVLKQMSPTKVNVFLPKFKFTEKYSLKELLEERVGQQLFYTGADFTRMTDQRKLVLNEILHKVVIEVNEKGTEATAATSIGMVSRSMDHDDVVQFKADHPFLYFINDRRTGMILFLGQVTHLTDYDEDFYNQSKKQKQENSDEQEEPNFNDEIMDVMKRRRYGFDKID